MTRSAYISVYIKMGTFMLAWYNWKKEQLLNDKECKKQ